MRRTVLFLLLLVTALPVIGQDGIHVRSCRPGLERIDVSKYTQRRASALRRTDSDTVANPYIGERRQLVVLAEFADQGFLGDSLQTLEQWDKILNARNLSDTVLYGSLHDYFYDQSYGQLDLGFDLFYVGVDSMKKYRSTYYDDENSKYLVQDVAKVLEDRIDDWAPYDWDNDGLIDQLLIVYAGKGQQDGGSSNTIWAHQLWLSEHLNASPVKVDSIGKDYFIDAYCCVQEISRNDDYGSFGTLCHEYSHCFGLPDFYNGSTGYVGKWDLMDDGNYSGGGFHPCGYSAFERAFMGWLTPVELKNDTVIEGMQALSDAPISYLVRNEGWADEYYLVENRQKKGWDEFLPGSGIVVFHLDYDEEVFLMGEVNTDKKQRYMIIPANDTTYVLSKYMKGWAYPYNGNNSLTNISKPAAELNNPNIDGSLLMSKPITEMAVAEGIASFSYSNFLTDVPYIPEQRYNNGDQWFTIDGRPLQGKPAVHGLYIRQGKVVLVR